ncbi:MAG: heavy-metal-associated domain-containing protein [Dehalococcoidia bacterium]|nr:heavy-metal-associated domain-containing protein [Dehalococcoidia bacterium]
MATTTELNVAGMTCDHCVRAVTNAIQEVPGVEERQWALDASKATVQHEGADMDAIFEAIREEGYEPALA